MNIKMFCHCSFFLLGRAKDLSAPLYKFSPHHPNLEHQYDKLSYVPIKTADAEDFNTLIIFVFKY